MTVRPPMTSWASAACPQTRAAIAPEAAARPAADACFQTKTIRPLSDCARGPTPRNAARPGDQKVRVTVTVSLYWPGPTNWLAGIRP